MTMGDLSPKLKYHHVCAHRKDNCDFGQLEIIRAHKPERLPSFYSRAMAREMAFLLVMMLMFLGTFGGKDTK